MPEIRVLIVDDHAILRQGIRSLLSYEAEIEVVGEAPDGATAVKMTGALHPDVVLMDIAMPGMSGLEATRLVRQKYPQTQVLVLSQHDERQYVVPLLQAGASGYLLKRALGEDLITAIRKVYAGEAFLDPTVTAIVVEEIHQTKVEKPAPTETLTPRELETLKYIVEGLPNSQIADKLAISENTIKKHLRNILKKLHVNNRVEAAVHAIREGLLD